MPRQFSGSGVLTSNDEEDGYVDGDEQEISDDENIIC